MDRRVREGSSSSVQCDWFTMREEGNFFLVGEREKEGEDRVWVEERERK